MSFEEDTQRLSFLGVGISEVDHEATGVSVV